MDAINDFSKPADARFVAIFDQVVQVMFDALNQENKKALITIETFRKHSQAYVRARVVLDKSKRPDAWFVAAKILQEAVNSRWLVLPAPHKTGIRKYIMHKIVQFAKTPPGNQQIQSLLTTLNKTLVDIAKHDWPHNWPTFVKEIVHSCKQGGLVCKNSMEILRLLSEEVFDFSAENMTSEKALRLKRQMNAELKLIFQICKLVLEKARQMHLLRAVLQTLERYIVWMPSQLIFENTAVISKIFQCFKQPDLRSVSLRCLSSIAALDSDPGASSSEPQQRLLRQLFKQILEGVANGKPAIKPTEIRTLYTSSSQKQQQFIQEFIVVLTQFVGTHPKLMNGVPSGETMVHTALSYICHATFIDDKEIFRICVEFWHKHAKHMFMTSARLGSNTSSDSFDFGTSFGAACPVSAVPESRVELYQGVRHALISKMAMPEEILVEKDNRTGEIITRTRTKGTELNELYNTMKEALVYFTHLDYLGTEKLMMEKLTRQVNGSEWSWNNLNRLCWAIGSISGTMAEQLEKRFLVAVIKDLLGLCEKKHGKNNKAVIASNIMYVVGQYPRFLLAHWRFLKTVINKLFEFMQETHPGVRDMACDTFVKIAKKCKKQFVIEQDPPPSAAPGAPKEPPFMLGLLANLPVTICDLKPHQVLIFFEALGYMIASEDRVDKQRALLEKMMHMDNLRWKQIIMTARKDLTILVAPGSIRSIRQFIKKNIAVCKALRNPFVHQMGAIFQDLMNFFWFVSRHIKSSIEKSGKHAMSHQTYQDLRAAKRGILVLIKKFIKVSKDPQLLIKEFLPKVVDKILKDYTEAPPGVKDATSLSVFVAIINKLGEATGEKPIAGMLKHVYDGTIPMITAVSPQTKSKFTDFPDIRLQYFMMIKVIISKCFSIVARMPPKLKQHILDSILWAIKHVDRNIHEMGLDMLLEFLRSMIMIGGKGLDAFYKGFFTRILKDQLAVLTDKLHKAGFPKQCQTIHMLLNPVTTGKIRVPIFPESADNLKATSHFLMKLLASQFKQLSREKATDFVRRIMRDSRQRVVEGSTEFSGFETLLRDFLLTLNMWSNTEMRELDAIHIRRNEDKRMREIRAAKAQVPGLLKEDMVLPDSDEDL